VERNEEKKQQKEMETSRRRGTGEGQTTAPDAEEAMFEHVTAKAMSWEATIFGVNLGSK
jgi:hypothetical protein